MKITRRNFVSSLAVAFMSWKTTLTSWLNPKPDKVLPSSDSAFAKIDAPVRTLRCWVRNIDSLGYSKDFHLYFVSVTTLPLPFGSHPGKLIRFYLPIEARDVCVGDEVLVQFKHYDGKDWFDPVIKNLTTGQSFYPGTNGYHNWPEGIKSALYRCPCGATWHDIILESETTAEEREADDAFWAEVRRRGEIIDAMWPEDPKFKTILGPDPKRERLCAACQRKESWQLAEEISGPDPYYSGLASKSPQRRIPMGRVLPLGTEIKLAGDI